MAREMHAEAIRRLPRAARRVLIDTVTRPSCYGPFRKLARACGIRTLRVEGDYGMIEGSLGDRAIFPVYARTKSWSPIKNRFLVDFFAASGGGTYLDIGANIGLTTIPVAQNPAVRCIAFEPEPQNFHHLARNVARNCPHRNVELLELALLDAPGTVTFELSRTNMGDHRLGGQGESGMDENRRSSIAVKAARLDDVVAARGALRAPLVAKIIAQGAESHIIAGGEATLAQAEIMILQFYPYVLERACGDPMRLCHFIARHFDSGVAMWGEQEEALAWRPIGDIVDLTASLAGRETRTPYDYCYLVLRKTELTTALGRDPRSAWIGGEHDGHSGPGRDDPPVSVPPL